MSKNSLHHAISVLVCILELYNLHILLIQFGQVQLACFFQLNIITSIFLTVEDGHDGDNNNYDGDELIKIF